jgi:hypothetical protein
MIGRDAMQLADVAEAKQRKRSSGSEAAEAKQWRAEVVQPALLLDTVAQVGRPNDRVVVREDVARRLIVRATS